MRIYTLVIALALASTAHATLTAIGTTTNGQPTDNGSDQFGAMSNGGTLYGIEFTVPFSAELYSLTVPLEFGNTTNDPDTMTFTLYSGGTYPNTAVALATDTITITSQYAEWYTFDFFQRPTELTTGVNYFLMGSIPVNSQFASVIWYGSPNNVPVTYVSYTSAWSKNTFDPGPAWQVELETPEPASLALIGAGLAALGISRTRISNKKRESGRAQPIE